MEQLEVGVMWNWRKCEVCGTAESLKYTELEAVSARYMEVQSVFTVCNYAKLKPAQNIWNCRLCEDCVTARSVQYMKNSSPTQTEAESPSKSSRYYSHIHCYIDTVSLGIDMNPLS